MYIHFRMGALRYINTPTVINDTRSNVSTFRVLTNEIDKEVSTASYTSSPSYKFTSNTECWILITYAVVLVICLIITCTVWRFRHHLFKVISMYISYIKKG